MRTGHVFTRDFDLETRQHELLGVDLGEGPPRKALVLGLALYLVWGGGLILLFGLPSELTFTLYFTPPGLIAYYGTRRSGRQERRWNLTLWALAIRYHARGHRPVVNMGRRAASRGEWIPRRGRWGSRLDTVLALPGFAGLERWVGPRDVPGEQSGPAVALQAKARLYGPDRLVAAHRRHERRIERKGAA